MYAADHLPPHFHILANDGRTTLVEISTLTVLAGSVGKKELEEALAWAALNQELLQAKWEKLSHV
ncbi:hypothetical protein AGMMS50256_05980 [Betaproteobacteria bacterium]|nr:hypothetical protein AGMMS50256_05980 [Betaproteobacteria bacterium]